MTKQANALLIIMVSFLFTYWLRWGSQGLPPHYLVALLVSLVIAAIVLPSTGAFRIEFEWAVMRRLRRLIAGWAVVLLILISVAAMLKTTDSYSRIWFGLWTMISSAGLVAVVLITHLAAIRKRNTSRQLNGTVLVGSGAAAARVEDQIRHHPASDMDLLACFGTPWSDQEVLPLAQLAEYVAEHKVKSVWIAAPWQDKKLLDDCLDALRESVVDVQVIPDLEQYRLLNQQITEWGGLPVISLSGTPMTGEERRLKFAFDWLIALMITAILSPIFLLVALMIKLTSSGPVLFRQKRHGVGGEDIEILKFRTMNQQKGGEDAFIQASENDERVTWFGRFLRKTSLDELPQLFNVLKGEMSLVGPRPHPLELNEEYKSRIPKYMLRHKVKPGITGWAQVNGYRGRTETKEKMALRIEHDLWYIQNWSLWLDLKILMMTPFVMIHRNAY
jgi:undecaprenyl-phosphate glucose phosphotransferase